jgi:diguanylate cyclase (GGDEF)-like protein
MRLTTYTKKTTLTISLLLIATTTIFFVLSTQYSKAHENFFTLLQKEKELKAKIELEVLHGRSFLYYNQDKISHAMERYEETLQHLSNASLFQYYWHRPLKKQIDAYLFSTKHYLDSVRTFQTLNSGVKNSLMSIATLSQKTLDHINKTKKQQPNYYKLLLTIQNLATLANSTLDENFVDTIGVTINDIQALNITDKRLKKLQESFILHVNLFTTQFPNYEKMLETIFSTSLQEEQKAIEQFYAQEAKNTFNYVNLLMIIFIALLFIAVAIIVIFYYQSTQENRRLTLLKEELETTLHTNYVTGCKNRLAYEKEISSFNEPTLLLINIDGFKNFNDYYGENVGDALLKQSAKLIEEAHIVSDNFTLFHLGGDEFGVVFEKIEYDQAYEYARYFLSRFNYHVFIYEKLELSLQVTIAIANTMPLLQNADKVLKIAKKEAKPITTYDPKLAIDDAIEAKFETVDLIKYAMHSDKVIPFFQGIVENKTEKIMKYESLMRIIDKDDNVITPFFFLDVAKQGRYYTTMTRTIFAHVISMIKTTPYSYSVNLSTLDIVDDELIDYIIDELRLIDASRIIFELTESEEIDNYDMIKAFVARVKRFGAKIAIDDFGSGYSNFVYIANLEIDFLKLDGSLIKDIHNNPNNEKIVKTIVDFASALGIETIAEFVEDEATYNTIKALGVTYSQGYYFSKPDFDVLK